MFPNLLCIQVNRMRLRNIEINKKGAIVWRKRIVHDLPLLNIFFIHLRNKLGREIYYIFFDA